MMEVGKVWTWLIELTSLKQNARFCGLQMWSGHDQAMAAHNGAGSGATKPPGAGYDRSASGSAFSPPAGHSGNSAGLSYGHEMDMQFSQQRHQDSSAAFHHHHQQEQQVQHNQQLQAPAYAIQSSMAGFAAPTGSYGLHSRHSYANPLPYSDFNASPSDEHGHGSLHDSDENTERQSDRYSPYAKSSHSEPSLGRRSPSPSRTKADKALPWFLGTPWHRRRFVAFLFLVLGFATRFYMIQHPHQVVFDEVHFGGFASHYMRRTYFFDVHPPTGKLMIALAGYLAGYDGQFTFKDIGMDYTKAPTHVPYVAMRSVPATCGALLVPLVFLIMMEFGFSIHGSALAAAMVLLENGFVTQSRLILLDSMLLFFIACSVYSIAKFSNLRSREFTPEWFKWLGLTGVSLGLALSVKWVGLFVIALVGLHTIRDLWRLLADLRQSMTDLLLHFLVRALGLIAIPMVIYATSFYIHFAILNTSGPGNAFMSSDFVSGLKGVIETTNTAVTYGSQITMQHVNTNAYFHSHSHDYPGGSKQQQITTYAHKDHNNWWVIRRATTSSGNETFAALPNPSQSVNVASGDFVFLTHVGSEKGLYMHGYAAPVTAGMYEVSAADDDGHPWELVFYKANNEAVPDTLTIAKPRFQLIRSTGSIRCALFSHAVQLPEWGFRQNEAACTTDLHHPGTVWQVTELNAVKHAGFSTTPAKTDRSGILTRLKDIADIQVIAWEANKRLTGEHVFQSRPESWPILSRGISFWQSAGKRMQVYLLGNPLLYWAFIPMVGIYFMIFGVYIIRTRRGCHDMDAEGKRKFQLIGDFFLLGWLLHYIPFFAMERQLFLHHYLPAHMFGILAVAALFDHLLVRLQDRWRRRLLGLLLVTFLYGFWYFAPLSYASPIEVADVPKMKWLSTWDFML
ncbi:mannosyltransferase, variant [Capsaspora owczarzaki ATCC 30864]|uniref:dolichyl-phosphate-mannose--protein mannosyltransferase n=1 Tax=Capsaspora owczarzaki (strain ATCC 30864) TaxID=595528 RepID=A0A0D2UFH0_CAPO3|nr:mannosyltransferase, variant [Capsaspora owczarzaki ATCC 30864]